MPMEVSCGQCHGRLLVETPGEIVACPHCRAHLMTPLPAPQPSDPPSAPHASRSSNLVNEQLEAIRRFSAVTIVAKGSVAPLFDEPAPIQSRLFEPGHPENHSTPSNLDLRVNPPQDVDATESVIEQNSANSDIPFEEDGDHSDIHSDAVNSDNVVDLEGDSGFPQDQFAIPDTRVALPDIYPQPEKPMPLMEGSASTPGPVGRPDFSWMSDHRRATPAASNAGVALNLSLTSAEMQSVPPTDPGVSESERPQSPLPAAMDAASPFNDFTATSPHTPAVPRPQTFHTHDTNDRNPGSEQAKAARSSMAMLLLVIGSYASLLTIYVVYLSLFGRQSQLESLPDLKTVQQLGGRAVVPRPANLLPPGHDLRLGEARRYGNLIATPLRVTRGPIAFTHFSGDPTQVRAMSAPVLKLWIKFENVSTNQVIAPLDTTLMFFRRIVNDRVASYNAIFPVAQRKQPATHFPFDRIAEDSEWRIVGQHTNEVLEPHQSFETFIPSEEHLDDLTGEIIWRVHFRKGHGPKSGNGVTTLIDVHFQSDQITADPA
ncbi:hypothetical protein [Schlesneria paludicola]|uniref:hypothetical protein n=1 Tax=Schlesneria paludicola TaxID=360056 RepID=UPI00029AA10D|nr:hypothetical protein [Schlesneria paludicola]